MLKATEREINSYVAERVRLRRAELNLTQKLISQRLGVSGQQYQKYETGLNRMSPGTLYVLAESFDVPVSYFFEDQDAPQGSEQWKSCGGPSPAELTKLLRDFHAIRSEKVRGTILNLMRSLCRE